MNNSTSKAQANPDSQILKNAHRSSRPHLSRPETDENYSPTLPAVSFWETFLGGGGTQVVQKSLESADVNYPLEKLQLHPLRWVLAESNLMVSRRCSGTSEE